LEWYNRGNELAFNIQYFAMILYLENKYLLLSQYEMQKLGPYIEWCSTKLYPIPFKIFFNGETRDKLSEYY
jgi:hypothetical protein